MDARTKFNAHFEAMSKESGDTNEGEMHSGPELYADPEDGQDDPNIEFSAGVLAVADDTKHGLLGRAFSRMDEAVRCEQKDMSALFAKKPHASTALLQKPGTKMRHQRRQTLLERVADLGPNP